MSTFHPAVLAITLTLLLALSTGAWSQTAAEHAQHHPTGVASAPRPAGAASAARPGAMNRMQDSDVMARMDQHMKAMREMHEKMAKAKTPAERQALMAEHMKLMGEGMAMMKDMPKGPDSMGGNMGRRHQMMEKRMDMMMSMMQMMMDRMADMPAK